MTEFAAGIPAELDATLLYRILRLRTDVFVVEQACPYPELDGRDLEPGALWVWLLAAHGEIAATLRILTEPDGSARIGRVATAVSARSGGVGGRMMRFALQQIAPERAVVLDAQSQLEGWYARFGFARSGPEFIEDDIPHVPMRKPAQA